MWMNLFGSITVCLLSDIFLIVVRWLETATTVTRESYDVLATCCSEFGKSIFSSIRIIQLHITLDLTFTNSYSE